MGVQLKDNESKVRRAIIDAFARIGSAGDRSLIDMLLTCVEDSSADVRERVPYALAQISRSHNADLIDKLSSYFRYQEWYVRKTALDALARASQRDDDLIPRVAVCLED